jgi:HSP20 family protein
MPSLIRWEPYRELMSVRDMMDRMMEDTFFRPQGTMGALGSPGIDMYQTDDEIVVKASLPGVKPEDINITITGDALTIRGEVNEEQVKDEASYQLRERRFGSFFRTLPLPSGVTVDKGKADFENGVLTLTLPKAEELKPKTITVKAK